MSTKELWLIKEKQPGEVINSLKLKSNTLNKAKTLQLQKLLEGLLKNSLSSLCRSLALNQGESQFICRTSCHKSLNNAEKCTFHVKDNCMKIGFLAFTQRYRCFFDKVNFEFRTVWLNFFILNFSIIQKANFLKTKFRFLLKWIYKECSIHLSLPWYTVSTIHLHSHCFNYTNYNVQKLWL